MNAFDVGVVVGAVVTAKRLCNTDCCGGKFGGVANKGCVCFIGALVGVASNGCFVGAPTPDVSIGVIGVDSLLLVFVFVVVKKPLDFASVGSADARGAVEIGFDRFSASDLV